MSENLFEFRLCLGNIKRAIATLGNELDKNRDNLKSDDLEIQHKAFLRDDEIHRVLSQLYDERAHVSCKISNINLGKDDRYCINFSKINDLLAKTRELTTPDAPPKQDDESQGAQSIFGKFLNNSRNESSGSSSSDADNMIVPS